MEPPNPFASAVLPPGVSLRAPTLRWFSTDVSSKCGLESTRRTTSGSRCAFPILSRFLPPSCRLSGYASSLEAPFSSILTANFTHVSNTHVLHNLLCPQSHPLVPVLLLQMSVASEPNAYQSPTSSMSYECNSDLVGCPSPSQL